LSGELVYLDTIPLMKQGDAVQAKANLELRKGDRILLKGPNGIGKTTLLNSIAHKTVPGLRCSSDLIIGYYTQDFHNLDFELTVHQSLKAIMGYNQEDILKPDVEHKMRSVAAGFLIGSEIINSPIGVLSEGQKGLVAFAHLVLQEPGLLILDEPTNHINFRHILIIAEALDNYQGAMILVSHVRDFVDQINIERSLDLENLL